MSRKLMFSLDVTNNALLQVNPKEFYTKALLENRSSTEFRQLLAIKEKTKISSLDFGDILTEADCDFVANNADLDAKTMDVCKIALNVEICQFEVEQSFLADWMKAGSNGDFMPAEFATHFYAELGRTVSDQLEYLTWQGDVDGETETYLDLCDGLEKKLAFATIPAAQRIAGTGITAGNVIAQMTLVYNQIPKALRNRKDDVKWFVSSNVAEAYRLAVAVQSAEAYTNKNPELSFLGYNLIVGEGMSDDTMTLSLGSNYIFLADLVSDPTDITTINMKETTGDRKIRVISDFKVGFDYLNDAEWVVYNIAKQS
jgi:hypothetical protein